MTHSLIIGGTKGLGRVVARQFAARDDRVSVIGRSKISQEAANDARIIHTSVDINDQDALTGALDAIVAARGPVNYCVFLQRYRGKDDDWTGEFQTTLTATRNVVEYLRSRFAPSSDNGIVMVSSVFARFVGEGQALSYHVAKAALDQMMRFYALNLGAEGIRVNGITPFTFLKAESKSFYLDNQALMDLYQKIVPLQRMGTTEDSANVISFLCSPQAAFVTGQNIIVDGGLSLAWPETLARKLAKV